MIALVCRHVLHRCHRQAQRTGPAADARKAFDEANALFEKTENDKALAAYDKAIALDPKQPDYHVGRCRTLARLMRHTEGIESCSTALKIDPNHAAALLERGHFLINVRQADKAIPDLIKARQLGADAYGVAYHLSLAYYVTGDFKKAAQEYEQCYPTAKTDDNRVACTAWQYVALLRAGRKEDAAKVLERVTPETKVSVERGVSGSAAAVQGCEERRRRRAGDAEGQPATAHRRVRARCVAPRERAAGSGAPILRESDGAASAAKRVRISGVLLRTATRMK